MRTGLPAEVPTLELCREMAAIPELAEAFKGSLCVWLHYDSPVLDHVMFRTVAVSGYHWPAAPTVREMLEVLTELAIQKAERHDDDNPERYDWTEWIGTDLVTDPDAVARACIYAAKAGT